MRYGIGTFLLFSAVFLIFSSTLSLAYEQMDFSADEKAQFIEAPSGLYVEKKFPSFMHGQAFWMDDSHLIFSTCELPDGWKCRNGGEPKIISEDIFSGKLKDTGYLGTLECFFNGVMRVKRNPDSSHADMQYYFGKIDSGIALVNIRPWHEFDCSSWVDDQGRSLQKIYENLYIEFFGSAGVSDPESNVRVVIRDANGLILKDFFARSDAVGSRDPEFIPFLGKYMFYGTIGPDIQFRNGLHHKNNAGGLLSKSGDFSPIEIAPFLKHLANAGEGDGRAFPTKAGILFSFTGRPQFQKKTGLYLYKDGVLMRISRGVRGLIVASDGCRVVLLGVNQDEYSQDSISKISTLQDVVLNVCRGDKK